MEHSSFANSQNQSIEQTVNEWLRAKVAASLADPRPAIPHDEVMAKMRKIHQSNCHGKRERVMLPVL
ncbi:hypothetical protein ACLB1R_09120 [Escherichia coli]